MPHWEIIRMDLTETYITASGKAYRRRRQERILVLTLRVTNIGPVENITVGYFSSKFIFHLGRAATMERINSLPGSLAMKSLENPTGRVLGMM